MIYKLAIGQFVEIPCPTTRPQNEELSQNSNPPTLEGIPSAPIRQGTPWSNAWSASENLFETRKIWPIPPTADHTPAPTIKMENPPQVVAIPHAMVILKQVAEKCTWGPHCPICKNKNTKRTGTAICRTNQECAPKIHSTPSNRMSSTPSHKILSILSHRTFSTLSHRTVSILRHKMFNAPSCRTLSSHLKSLIGMQNKLV